MFFLSTSKSGLLAGIFQYISEAAARKNLRRGDTLRQQGNLEKAITAYHHAIWWDARCAAAYYNLAETLTQRQSWEDAADAFRLAFELNPDFTPAFLAWVEVLFSRRRWSKVIDACLLAIELNPRFFEAYDQLGDVYSKTNRMDQACDAYLKGIAIAPDAWHTHQKLGYTLLKQDQWETAESTFNHAIELKPDYCWSFDGLGDALVHQHRWNEAAAAYRRAVELNPDNPWHSFKQGDVLKHLGDWEQAAIAFQRCYELNPDLHGLKDRRDEVLKQQAQWSRLIDYCDSQHQLRNRSVSDNNHNVPLRILMITAYPPYPPTGGAIRLQAEIEYFGTRHRLVVASFYFSDSDEAIRQSLAPHCEFMCLLKLGARMANPEPHLPEKVRRWTTRDMWRAMQRLSELNFDIVLFDFVFVSQYRELFKESFTVLEEHNIESEILQQMLDAKSDNSGAGNTDTEKARSDLETETRMLREYEDSIWPGFSLRTTVSDEDRRRLTSRCRTGETLIVNNGVNTGGMTPVEHCQTGKILFMGHMGYYPNEDAMFFFVTEILPLLWQDDPTVNFCIAGRNPTTSVLAMTDDPRIEVIANPEDMRVVASHCCMTVVPLRMGSGTRLKILESLSMALPVVSTQLGCEGLSVTDGKHLLIRDEPEAFAKSILRIRAEPELSNHLRINGRRLVKEQYDWSGIFATYERKLMSRISNHSHDHFT